MRETNFKILAGLGLAFLVLGCGSPAPSPDAAGTPAAAEKTTASGAPWLVEVTGDAGIGFVHETGATGDLLFPEMSGSGAAVFDADGDGHNDLLLISGAPQSGEGDGKTPVHRLYLGRGDTASQGIRFTDATATAGLGGGTNGMGVAVGDYDNDGHQDVYISYVGPDRLLRGHGDGTFEDVTARAGITLDKWAMSTVFCDLDRDGFLDLYVSHYVVYDRAQMCTDNAGRREYCGPDSYPDEIDHLLRNNGDGTFTDVTVAAGIDQASGAGLGVVCEDLNDDGWADVYVANDGDPNQLWINQGALGSAMTFVDEALILGVGVNAEGMHEAGMGVVAADLDTDADFDIFLSHLRDETNTFYRNLGSGMGFADQTVSFGLGSASAPYTGFGLMAFDVELDGDLDLAVVNGRVLRGKPLPTEVPAPWDAYVEPNLFFLNEGASFRQLGPETAPFTEPTEVSRGLAAGDLDGDGDLDLVLTNIQGPARIYRNDAPRASGHWLIVDAFEPALNRRALGARITVDAAGKRQIRGVQGAMSYLSSSDPRAHFGLGDATAVDEVVVRWVDGTEEVFTGVAADQAVTLVRGEGTAR